MLASIYHMTLRLFCHYVRNSVMDVTTFPKNL